MNCEFGFWELLWNIFNFLTASSLNLRTMGQSHYANELS
jgi:hypothetical protein